MRSLFIVMGATAIISFTMGCKSGGSSGPKTFCDTICLKDSMKFTGDHKLTPYVYISTRDCKADTLSWGHKGMEVRKQAAISDLLGKNVIINPGYLKCYIRDTSYIWLVLNNCLSGKGYLVKLDFNGEGSVNGKAINSTDPAFKVADKLVAWTDGGNIFVEDAMTGKAAQMTFGVDLHIDDYSMIHEYIESVNITPGHISAKVKINKEWVVKEKDITLE